MTLDVSVICPNIRRRDGQGRVMLEICRSLCERGHRVHAYSATCARELLHLPTFTWRKVFMPKGPDVISLAVFALTASRASKSRRHDVMVIMGGCALPSGRVYYYAPFAQATWQAERLRAGNVAIHQRAFGRFAVWLESKALSRTSVLLPTSERIGEELAHLLAPDAEIEVVPGGVNIDEFPPVDSSMKPPARAQLGIAPDRFAIALIGEFATGRKGLDVLVAALKDGRADEVVLVHGEGPTALANSRFEREAPGRVMFLDPQAPVQQVMAASDIVAIPSIYEPFSLVALEAASSRLPIVISERAGAASYLGDGAIAVDPTSAQSIREAIDRIRDEPGLAERIASRARSVAEDMTWEKVAAVAAERIAGPGTRSTV